MRHPSSFLPRRKAVVHPKQKRFALLLLVAQVVTILVYSATIQVRLLHYLKRSTTLETWETVSKIMSEGFIALFLTGAVTAVFLYLLGLWMSNRILGPVPRLQRALRQVAEGDTSVRLKFRPGDYLEDLADDFNAAMDAVEGKPVASSTQEEAERARSSAASQSSVAAVSIPPA